MIPARPVVALLFVMLGALAAGGCRHTWDGAKADTKRVVKKTGEGIEKAGQTIEDAGDGK